MAAHSGMRVASPSIDEAIERAADHLWSKQCGDGSWNVVAESDFLRHEGSRLSPIDNLVHGLTVGVIEAQRLPMMFGAALQRAFDQRERERRAADPTAADNWNLPST